MDKLEAAEGNRNICQRSEAEIEEFFLHMSRDNESKHFAGRRRETGRRITDRARQSDRSESFSADIRRGIPVIDFDTRPGE